MFQCLIETVIVFEIMVTNLQAVAWHHRFGIWVVNLQAAKVSKMPIGHFSHTFIATIVVSIQ